MVRKSILKSGPSTTPPPVDLPSIPFFQTQYNHPDDSPRTSVKINTDQSIPFHYPTMAIEKRIPIEPIFSATIPLSSKHRMRFANVQQLNDIEWEVPREFQTTFYSNHERRSSTMTDSKTTHTSWLREMNFSQTHYSSNDDITQQQAFEY